MKPSETTEERSIEYERGHAAAMHTQFLACMIIGVTCFGFGIIVGAIS